MTTQAQFNAFFQSKRPVNVSSHNNNVTKTYFIDANHFISIDLDNHGGAMDFALVKAAYPLTGNATPPIWVAFFQNGPTAGPTTVMGTSQSIV
jgi:hypothetical protein